MTAALTAQPPAATQPPAPPQVGRLGRLGRGMATHLRWVLAGWIVVLAVFASFAPQVQNSLAGAGWEASGSQSVAARNVISRHFQGMGAFALQVVIRDTRGPLLHDAAGRAVLGEVTALLRSSRDVRAVLTPQPGTTLSRGGHTGIVEGGAGAGPNAMVATAHALSPRLAALARPGVSVALTGDAALWADFNAANHSAMMHSELLSWPVTLVILVVAFGSLVAAGLPLMLTMAGLLVAAGALVLANHLAPVSIWALNFALMFALALGIDYALFLVMRFRAALGHQSARLGPAASSRDVGLAAVAETMDTAGKAVAFSALTVLASLSAVLLVPSPAFRSMALGIMLAVVAVLAATLTLLPAVLGRLGTRVDNGRVPFGRLAAPLTATVRAAGRRLHALDDRLFGPDRRRRAQPANTTGLLGLEHRLHRWAHLLWRRPLLALGALAVIGALSVPLVGLRTGMPSITVIPASQSARAGYVQVSRAFGVGAPGTLQVVSAARQASVVRGVLRHDRGIAAVVPGGVSGGWALTEAIPTSGPSTTATGATIERIRRELPAGTLVGGAAAENHDLQAALAARTPLVFGVLLGMGFLLLLVALGSPLLAFAGVAANALSVAGAFGVARLVFQNGDGAGLLNFAPQGFIDAWAPIFFGAMVSGVAMDYTLFLLSAAKEHYDTSADPRQAMVKSVHTSGRVIVAAAFIMVAVFLTFALSGPLAPKEMGVILAVAVAIDAVLVRLLLLPVLLRVAGHRAWSSPRWLRRVLPQVSFSH